MKTTFRTILIFTGLIISIALNAQIIDEISTWEYGPTEAVAVKDSTAYISSGSYLWVLDISDESNPTLVSEARLENYISYIRRVGNYLYVSKEDTLLNIYDIHTADNPVLVNQIEGTDADYPWKDNYIEGDTIYISGYYNRQYFINDTINLQYIRRAGHGEQSYKSGTVMVGLWCADRYFAVYNLAIPGDVTGSSDNYTASEEIRGISIHNYYAYFGYGSKGVGIINIANPYSIIVQSTVNTGGYTYDVELIEDTILVAARGLNGIGVYDIEEDTVFTLIGECDTDGYPYELQIEGNRIYAGARSGGLIIIDISDLTNPVVIGEYQGYGECRRIFIEGDRLYTASGDGGVMIMDITDRENPTVISQCWTRGISEDVVKQGNYLYVADGDSGLTVIDITDENNPSIYGYSPVTFYSEQVKVDGDYCAVGGWLDMSGDTLSNGTGLIDISTPSSPTYIRGINKGEYKLEFELIDTLLHTVSVGGITPRYSIWDISNMSNPIIRDSVMGGSGSMRRFTIQNDTVIFEYGSTKFEAYDVANVDDIVIIDSIEKPSWSKLLRRYGNYLIEGDYNFKINIWDVSDIFTADTIASTGMKDGLMDIEKTGYILYSSFNKYGLSIYGFDFDSPASFSIISPAVSDSVNNAHVNVIWESSDDTGVGLDRYEVYINGTKEGETKDTMLEVTTTYTGNRNIWVLAYDKVGNSTSSDTVNISLYTGIEDNERVQIQTFTIHNNMRTISVYNPSDETRAVEVTDITGRVVDSATIKPDNTYTLSPKAGIYFVIDSKAETASKMIIIK